MGLRIRVGAICLRKSSLLLVEHEKAGERYWLLPGGGLEKEESCEAAIVREVCEETGITIKPGRLVCVCETISPDRVRHIVHFIFETEYVSGEPATSRDSRVRGSLFVPFHSIERLELRPPLRKWLQSRLSDGFLTEVEYLGALWT